MKRIFLVVFVLFALVPLAQANPAPGPFYIDIQRCGTITLTPIDRINNVTISDYSPADSVTNATRINYNVDIRVIRICKNGQFDFLNTSSPNEIFEENTAVIVWIEPFADSNYYPKMVYAILSIGAPVYEVAYSSLDAHGSSPYYTYAYAPSSDTSIIGTVSYGDFSWNLGPIGLYPRLNASAFDIHVAKPTPYAIQKSDIDQINTKLDAALVFSAIIMVFLIILFVFLAEPKRKETKPR